MNTDTNQIPINSIILHTKSYIIWCARNSKTPHITQLQKRVKSMIILQKGMHRKNTEFKKFTEKILN